jgi:hypothetical protein
VLIAGHGGIFTFTLPDLCPDVCVNDLIQSENHNTSITRIKLTLVGDQPVGELIDWANTDHLYGKAAELVPGTPQD